MNQYRFDQEKFTSEISEINRKITSCSEHYPKFKDIQVSPTAKTEEYSEGKIKLFRYHNPTDIKNRIPILITYALVNRPYILDLEKNRSFIHGLLEQGLDVYLIDWGYPSRKDRFTTMDDYICGYIHRCVKHITRQHQIDKINILGVCQGGTFGICYAALFPELIQNIVCMITPVDFNKTNSRLSHMVEHIDIDALVESYGNIPGDILNWNFIGVNPADHISRKYLGYMDKIDDKKESDFFLRMEKWSFDCPDQAGESFRKFCKELYQENRLINDTFYIDKQKVSLKNLTMPILNIYAKNDLIVPQESSSILKTTTSSEDYTAIELGGGHIGMLVKTKKNQQLPQQIAQWLNNRVPVTSSPIKNNNKNS